MNWKTDYRSIYYLGAPEPPDLDLVPAETALLVIDVQNTYLDRPDPATLSGADLARYHALDAVPRAHARDGDPDDRAAGGRLPGAGASTFSTPASPACCRTDATARSARSKPGWNNLLLPKDEAASQIVPAIGPVGHEIVVTKTTDSALTGTNLRLAAGEPRHHPRRLRAASSPTSACPRRCARWPTRASTSSSSRTPARPASDELHRRELEILNMIYCQVVSAAELKAMMGL
jgi:nicotinamidase-related amidase